MPPKPKDDYESLKKIWYKKLKSSGFDDIENERGELKHYSSSDFFTEHHLFDRFTHQTKLEIKELSLEAKAAYYRMAGSFLEHYPFKTALDRKVWGYYAEGVSRNEIPTLVSTPKVKVSVYKVKYIVSKLRKIMLGGLG